MRYLKALKRNMLIAIAIVVAFFFAFSYTTQSLDNYAKTVHEEVHGSAENGESTYQSQGTQLKWILGLLVPALVLIIAVQPVFRYRRHTRQITSEKLSLKEMVFNHVFKFFGEFTFKRQQGISITDLHDAMILPEYDEYRPEDRISGVYQGTKIEISEAKLITRYHGKRVAVFNGLLVVLDICNPDTILRGPFRGNTIIIQDDKKNLEYTKTKFQGYDRVNLPTKELEGRFEVLTTDKSEAEVIVHDTFLKAVLKLAKAIQTAPEQVTHLDDKIMVWLATKAMFLGSILFSLASIPFNIISVIKRRPILTVWDIEEFSPAKHVDIYKKTKSTDLTEVQAINEDIQCSFYKDKVLITIPYKHDLFEPNSIFQPALIEADLHLVFAMMNAIGELCNVIADTKAKVDQ